MRIQGTPYGAKYIVLINIIVGLSWIQQTHAANAPELEKFEWLTNLPSTTTVGHGPLTTDINDRGDLIGIYQQSVYASAFTFIDDTYRRVPFSASNTTHARGINNDGVVVGTHGSSGYIWDPRFGPLLIGGSSNQLSDINNAGVATGTRGGVSFRFPGGNLIAPQSSSVAINDAGDVAGIGSPAAGGTLWINRAGVTDTLVNLNPVYYTTRSTLQLNAAGQMAGTLTTSSGSAFRGYRWNSGLEILAPLADYTRSSAFGIDDLGRVVGVSQNDSVGRRATMWIDGSKFDLNEVFGPMLDGGSLREAGGISDNGAWVTGTGVYQGEQRAWRAQLALAGLFVWVNDAGGSYADAENWDISATPGANDEVLFELPNSYSVALVEDAAVHGARVRAGDVRFELGAFDWQVDELVVENNGSGVAQLSIVGGSVDVSTAAIVAPAAAAVESLSTLVSNAVTLGIGDGLRLDHVDATSNGDVFIGGTLSVERGAGWTTNAEVTISGPGRISIIDGDLDTRGAVAVFGTENQLALEVDGDWSHTGSLNVLAGDVEIRGAAVFAGEARTAQTGVLRVAQGGQLTALAPIAVSDTGGLVIKGQLSSTSVIDLAGGHAEIVSGSLGSTSAQIRIREALGGSSWGRIGVRDGGDVRAANIEVEGGAFGAGAMLEVDGASLTSNSMSLAGTMTVHGSGSATVASDMQIGTYGLLSVGEWSGGGTFGGSLNAAQARLEVGSSLVDEFLSDDDLGRLIIGDGGRADAHAVVVHGAVEVLRGGTLQTETIDVHRSLAVLSGGKLNVRSAMRVVEGGTADISGYLDVADGGLLEIEGDAGQATTPTPGRVVVRNGGVLDVAAITVNGSLAAINGGTVTMGDLIDGPVAGAVNVGEGAVLSGSGTIFGNVLLGNAAQAFAGRIAPGGVAPVQAQPGLLASNPAAAIVVEPFGSLRVEGDVNLFGVLEIEIGSAELHDVFEVTGSLILAGELRLVFVDGYRPATGDEFSILLANMVSGGFERITSAGLAPGVTLNFSQGEQAWQAVVSAVPLPGAIVYFVSALFVAGVGASKRRAENRRLADD